MFTSTAILIAVVVIVVFFVLAGSAVKILREYERAVIFTLGRFAGVKGPGLVLLWPFAQQMVRVDLRIVVMEVPTQDVISRNNVSMKVDAVLYFRVVDPKEPSFRLSTFSPPQTCSLRLPCDQC